MIARLLAAIRRAQPALAEAAALARLAQTELAVRIHLDDLERARVGLAKSLAARDDALACIRTIELSPTIPHEVPRFLRRATQGEVA